MGASACPTSQTSASHSHPGHRLTDPNCRTGAAASPRRSAHPHLVGVDRAGLRELIPERYRRLESERQSPEEPGHVVTIGRTDVLHMPHCSRLQAGTETTDAFRREFVSQAKPRRNLLLWHMVGQPRDQQPLLYRHVGRERCGQSQESGRRGRLRIPRRPMTRPNGMLGRTADDGVLKVRFPVAGRLSRGRRCPRPTVARAHAIRDAVPQRAEQVPSHGDGHGGRHIHEACGRVVQHLVRDSSRSPPAMPKRRDAKTSMGRNRNTNSRMAAGEPQRSATTSARSRAHGPRALRCHHHRVGRALHRLAARRFPLCVIVAPLGAPAIRTPSLRDTDPGHMATVLNPGDAAGGVDDLNQSPPRAPARPHCGEATGAVVLPCAPR